MNREQIISMAQEAGAELAELPKGDAWLFTDDECLERFAAIVASAERESLRESFRVVTAAEASAAILHEREACARAYEAEADTWTAWPQAGAAKRKGAAAIRARRQA